MVHYLSMGLNHARHSLGLLANVSSDDGMDGWNELVKGLHKTLDHNAAMLGPVAGLTVLIVVVVLVDWKLAAWCARVWQRHHRS